MSFASQVKSELCRAGLNRKCCAVAEAYGILLFCNRFAADGIRVVTENDAFAARLPLLFKKAFKLTFDRLPAAEETGKRVFSVTRGEKLAAIREVYGMDPSGLPAHHVNYGVLEERCCQLSFLRGAFLAGGSVTDPEKGYHLELATSHYNVSREAYALMQECGLSPKQTVRKSNYVTYFKQSESIEDFLTAVGAPVAAMEIMNAKVEKTLRCSVNRRVNCDAANLDKTVEAAQGQLAAIRQLDRSGRMETLPEKLREAALLRLEHPEDSLEQLAALCDPPVTKSALNHRLRKLMALAREKES